MNVTSAGGVADLAPLDGLRRDMARTFAYGRSAFVVSHVRRAVDELNRDLDASAQWAATRSDGDGTMFSGALPRQARSIARALRPIMPIGPAFGRGRQVPAPGTAGRDVSPRDER